MAAGNATPEDFAASLSEPDEITETDEGETAEPTTIATEPESPPEAAGEGPTSHTSTDDVTPPDGDSAPGAGLDDEDEEGADADARAFEALVSGETNSEEETEDDILTLEEPADGEATEPAPPAAEAPTKRDTGTETPKATDPDVGKTQGSGLSDEERGDLEKLIKGFNEDTGGGTSTAVVETLQKQISLSERRVVKLGKMVLANDKKLKSCYEVMRLQQKKAEIMNQRIDALVDALNNGKQN